MAGNELIADLAAIGQYGMKMQFFAGQAGVPIATKLSGVEVDSAGAFNGFSDAGTFAEGSVMQAAMAKQSYAFNAFLADMTRGLMAIGNAANVCAHAYSTGDIEAAEKMNLLGFAFATDPDAKAPPGVPKGIGETMLDQSLKQQDSGLPEALTDPNGGTTAQVYGSGYLTTYSDGSSKMVHSEPITGAPGASMMVTTITGANGQVISTTTTHTRYNANGTSNEYFRKTVTAGTEVDNGEGKKTKSPDITVVTETSDAPNGDKVITKTTTVGEAAPKVEKTTVDPTPTAPVTTPGAGPLEKTQDVLGPEAGKIDWRKGYQGVEAPSS
ncbi:hypothetical protein [Cryptosporangium aurantiacum]|uniref:Uncharacterized protein n=1 Tax=Cryptosporangium aurantiacum TaxID=134849 RepID=A0A1M7TXK9_9ACTN|nr:hypothetical protein [Cryptosporangium aurantiacum]SHN75456.1 hypothetical protein SAMN05443668_107301 [Cryptosporangium aurantiacum]